MHEDETNNMKGTEMKDGETKRMMPTTTMTIVVTAIMTTTNMATTIAIPTMKVSTTMRINTPTSEMNTTMIMTATVRTTVMTSVRLSRSFAPRLVQVVSDPGLPGCAARGEVRQIFFERGGFGAISWVSYLQKWGRCLLGLSTTGG